MKRTFTTFIIIFLLTSAAGAQTADWLWAKSAGANGYDYGQSVVADKDGNTYFTGYFAGTIVFDLTHSFTSNGSSDFFIIKYDPEGNIIWAKSGGGTDGEISGAVAVDDDGNLYLTGSFKSSQLVLGTTTLVNSGGNTFDIFLVKYDADGEVLWAKGMGGTGDDRGNSVAVDGLGNCVMTGYFVSTSITFGGFTLNNSGGVDLYVVKYTPTGYADWAISGTGTGFDYSVSVACDKSDNAYIAGNFNGPSLTIGSSVLTGPANTDIFVAKISPAGIPLWAKQAGVTSDNSAYSVAADTVGNCYISGVFKGSTLVFGTTTLTNQGHYDMFLAKYDPIGNPIWAISAGGTEEDGARAVTVDKYGYCYLGGYFKSSQITIGGTTLVNTAVSKGDMAIAEFSPAGDAVMIKQAGGTGDEVLYSMAIDPQRNFYIVGYFGSPTLVFGNTTLICGGTIDPFIAKSTNVPLLGVNDIVKNTSVSIYPNPASDHINIDLEESSVIEIYNTNGQICSRISAEGNAV